nr:myrosinase 1-like [Onthophagus taurus]
MSTCASSQTNQTFPNSFKFGVASSAYQVEGGWNLGGKGESIWDRLTHSKPKKIKDRSNADISCDSYHKVLEDVQLLKDLDVDFYKFSISWPRILPTGHVNNINSDGIRYYNELIDELIANGIRPVATMFHWDLPQLLQEKGGWLNEKAVLAFEEYANLLFSMYGNRVRDWITFDDPGRFCFDPYYQQTSFADGLKEDGNVGYLCAHAILKSHATVYRLYNFNYRERQHGRIGISFGSTWMEPGVRGESDDDISELAMQLELGWFAHPIFSRIGDYPKMVSDQIDYFTRQIQTSSFIIPEFESADVEFLRGSSDFFGLTHYTTKICDSSQSKFSAEGTPLFGMDFCGQNEQWENGTSPWLQVVPWGIRKLLNWIKKEYDNPEVFITANGFSDDGSDNDCRRVHYINSYLEHILAAIYKDNCNVSAYTVWSFLDSFQWYQGYTEKFGLYNVDFNALERTRTAKLSSMVYTNIIKQRKIDWDYSPEGYKMCKWGLSTNGTA